jgi:RimJ/RimL family protein N-acetyltransferase
VLSHAFDVVQLDRAVAEVDAPNVASIAVLERLGMNVVEDAARDRPTFIYEKTRANRDRTIGAACADIASPAPIVASEAQPSRED